MSAADSVTIYHNPACGKSRGALEILHQRGLETEIVEYLDHPPDRAALERILGLLGGPPSQLVRKDKRFRELGLRPEDYGTRSQVIDPLPPHPELMDQSGVIQGQRAVTARPSERVLELIDWVVRAGRECCAARARPSWRTALRSPPRRP